MNCQLARRSMSAVRDGQLDRWTTFWVKLHLFVCPPCRRTVKSFDRTLDALRSMAEASPEAESEPKG